MSLSPEERITMRDLHLERCDMFLHSADISQALDMRVAAVL